MVLWNKHMIEQEPAVPLIELSLVQVTFILIESLAGALSSWKCIH